MADVNAQGKEKKRERRCKEERTDMNIINRLLLENKNSDKTVENGKTNNKERLNTQ